MAETTLPVISSRAVKRRWAVAWRGNSRAGHGRRPVSEGASLSADRKIRLAFPYTPDVL